VQPTLPHGTRCLASVLWHRHSAIACPAPFITAARYHPQLTPHTPGRLPVLRPRSLSQLLLRAPNCQPYTLQPWPQQAAPPHRKLALPPRCRAFLANIMTFEDGRRPAAGSLGPRSRCRCQDLGIVGSTPPANVLLRSPRSVGARQTRILVVLKEHRRWSHRATKCL
jgi:hypothetical protein